QRLWANDLLHRVDRKRRGFLLKFQSEIGENRVDRLQVCEVHITCTIWRRRGQPHRPPTLSGGGEDAGEGGSVYNGLIRPVRDVVSEVVHIDCSRVQRMTEADDEGVAALGGGAEDASGRGRLRQLWSTLSDDESIN